MRLLRMAIEMQKWDLAAHVVILGAITAREKEKDDPYGGKESGRQRRSRTKRR